MKNKVQSRNRSEKKRPSVNKGTEMISCDVCNFQCESKAKLIVHINLTHPKQKMEEDFNCDKCAFQGTTQLQLNKHLNLKHLFTEQKKEVIKCRHCDQQFSEKWNLMNHRKLKHIETVAYFMNSLEGKCIFTQEMKKKLNVLFVTTRLKQNPV